MPYKERRTSYQTGIELESTKIAMVNAPISDRGDIDENEVNDKSNGINHDKKSLLNDNATFDIIEDEIIDTNLRYSIIRRCSKKPVVKCMMIVVIISIIGIISIHNKPNDKLTSQYCTNDPISSLESTSSISNIKNGAVATDEKLCSELSLSILEKHNGNAVDAAVTAALCLGVVNPASSGMGGGSFILIHMKNNNITEVIDAREEAPSLASEDMMQGNARLSLDGGLAIAIPGELRGLELAHQRHGKLAWKAVVTPVIALAQAGFPVSATLANEIQAVKQKILQFPNLARLLSRNNDGVNLLQENDLFYQPNLANTLQLVADHGADILYQGDIAQQIVSEINDAGGIFTINDLRNYKPIIRKPLVSDVEGFTIVGVPPPSSGGAVIIGAARFLLNYKEPFASFQHTLSKHRYVEALKHTFAMRMSMSDPAFENNDVVNDLIQNDYIHYLRNMTSDYDILPLEAYGGKKWSQLHNITAASHDDDYLNHPNRRTIGFHYLNDHGTSSFSVVDKHRNAVTMTSTINTIFGSGVVSPSTGIIFNSDMDDFSSPNMTNVFGLQPSKSNYIKPNKRPLSSMSPTLIFRNDQLFIALGSSGGPKIISAVLQTFLNHAILGIPLYNAVSNPRIHNQLLYQGKDTTVYDSSLLKQFRHQEQYIQLSNTTIQALVKRNQILLPVGYLGTCQAISVDLENDLLTAVSDIRKMGFPAGY